MKKLKRVYLLELAIAVTISLGIGTILGMKVFSHLYAISGIQARTDMSLSKRMDILERRLKQCEDKEVKPVKISNPVNDVSDVNRVKSVYL